MRKIHVEDLLKPVGLEHSWYLLEFFERNLEEITKTNTLNFAPYQYSIRTREDFRAKAYLGFDCCPVERDTNWRLAEDLDRFEAELFLSKADGRIFYKNLRSEPLEVASSFVELWAALGQTVPEEPDEDVSIDEETRAALKACFSREDFSVIEKIYARINDDRCGNCVDCLPEAPADVLVYERGAFYLEFPFTKPRDKRLALPEDGDWWEIGIRGGDEDVSADDGILFLDARSGQIFLCELFPDWVKDAGKSLLQTLLEGLIPSFLRPKKPYLKTFERVANSFVEFITRLEQHGWKPLGRP